ncbi:MAG: diacylglycerol kinase, partial [Patescibacteria group bacterium]
LIKSFKYAFYGLYKIFRAEQNIRIQITIGFFVVLLGWYFKINRFEWIILILIISLVILMEIINSVIERTADILKPRIHTYAREIKDIMAAAVMIASIIAVIIGLIIFLPYVNPVK